MSHPARNTAALPALASTDTSRLTALQDSISFGRQIVRPDVLDTIINALNLDRNRPYRDGVFMLTTVQIDHIRVTVANVLAYEHGFVPDEFSVNSDGLSDDELNAYVDALGYMQIAGIMATDSDEFGMIQQIIAWLMLEYKTVSC